MTQQSKPVVSPNFMDIKLVTVEHPKTSYKLFKTMRQASRFLKQSVPEQILPGLYIMKQQNVKTVSKKKNAAIAKVPYAYKGYAISL